MLHFHSTSSPGLLTRSELLRLLQILSRRRRKPPRRFPPDPDAFPGARISPHPFPETQKNHEKTAEVFLKAFFALK
jgi:hypothetical protein